MLLPNCGNQTTLTALRCATYRKNRHSKKTKRPAISFDFSRIELSIIGVRRGVAGGRPPPLVTFEEGGAMSGPHIELIGRGNPAHAYAVNTKQQLDNAGRRKSIKSQRGLLTLMIERATPIKKLSPRITRQRRQFPAQHFRRRNEKENSNTVQERGNRYRKMCTRIPVSISANTSRHCSQNFVVKFPAEYSFFSSSSSRGFSDRRRVSA